MMLIAAIAILYAPLLYTVFDLYWRQGASTHAPILLTGILVGLWEARSHFRWRTPSTARHLSEALLIGGLVVYGLALLVGFFDLAFASSVPIGIGCILLAGGWPAVRRLWPLEAALIFAIPLSDTTLDGVFLPAKILLTKLVTAMLGGFGYPIADSGAVISIGFNTLLIANACTGLQSLWALISVGLLYIYFAQPESRGIKLILLLATAPLALFANFLRLTALVLTSYYLGTGASRQFHHYAAYIEVAFALLMFLALHAVLVRLRGLGRAR